MAGVFDKILQHVAERGLQFGEELGRWMLTVQAHALPKWGPVVAASIACTKTGAKGKGFCTRQALAACLVCREAVCLEHAVISPTADVACTECMHKMAERAIAERDAEQAQHGPPPGMPVDNRVRDSMLARLGLARGADEDDLRRAHKKLSAKWHPDRYSGQDRAHAERQYKLVQEAFAFLTKHGTSERAA